MTDRTLNDGPTTWTERPETAIEAGAADRDYWRDLWRYRELLVFLAWRDLSVRYRQALLGITWAVLRPLVTMVAYTVVFGVIARLPSNGAPYSLVVMAALVPWQFFTMALNDASNAIVGNAGLVGKIYFPRLILPLAGILPSLVDLAISCAILFGMMLCLGVWPTWRLLLFPIFLCPALIAAIGIGLWTSAINVTYRDMRFVLPLFIQLAFFISPVAYTMDIVPPNWRVFFSVNPLIAVLDGCRWSVLGDAFAVSPALLLYSYAASLAVLAGGVAFFRRAERLFADVI